MSIDKRHVLQLAEEFGIIGVWFVAMACLFCLNDIVRFMESHGF